METLLHEVQQDSQIRWQLIFGFPAVREFLPNAGGFIKALESGNYEYWKSVIPADKRANIDQKKFDDMRKELISAFGEFSSASYLGRLVTGKIHSYLWTLTFEKAVSDGREKFEIVYFVRVHCEKDKAPAINGFGVKLF